MQRVRTHTVTDIPILIPCAPEEQDGLATFLMELLPQPQPVRVVTDAVLNPQSREFKEALSTMWDDQREEFKATLLLLRALQSNDQLAIIRARSHVRQALTIKHEGDKKRGIVFAQEDNLDFGRLLIHVFGLQPGQEKEAIQRWNRYRRGPRAEADDRWLLSQLMSEALDPVRLVLWWSGSQFRPALYCPELKAAVYAFLLMKIIAGRGWGVCPHCGNFFVQKRSDQNYCSIAHREAHRVARWRAAKAARSKKKGGHNGTRKAR